MGRLPRSTVGLRGRHDKRQVAGAKYLRRRALGANNEPLRSDIPVTFATETPEDLDGLKRLAARERFPTTLGCRPIGLPRFMG